MYLIPPTNCLRKISHNEFNNLSVKSRNPFPISFSFKDASLAREDCLSKHKRVVFKHVNRIHVLDYQSVHQCVIKAVRSRNDKMKIHVIKLQQSRLGQSVQQVVAFVALPNLKKHL